MNKETAGSRYSFKGKARAGPQFVRFFAPILEALREHGGSGRPKEVNQAVAEKLGISDQDLDRTLKNGTSRFGNQIAWGRFYLTKAGLMSSPSRGIWTLTETGRATTLTPADSLRIFNEVQSRFANSETSAGEDDSAAPDPKDDVSRTDLSLDDQLTTLLRALPPDGFERLCQRILREIGFEEVEVTGKSGDGGIDGVGLLRFNVLMTDRVVFQCKRYSSPVTPSQIRDLRGALSGRADRGIFICTSTFTAEARREAARSGAIRIELVDLESLLMLLKERKLGVATETMWTVDERFFAEFK